MKNSPPLAPFALLCLVVAGILTFIWHSFSPAVDEVVAAAGSSLVYLPHVRAPGGLWSEPFAVGFDQPTSIQHDGTDYLYVAERAGAIWRVDANGMVAATPFLDITAQVNADFLEQGLLGLAFHPDYASNGYFYVTYTELSGALRLSRFSVSSADPELADPASEELLLTVLQYNAVHQGGDLAFGPDGYLYASLGDGGYGSGVDFAQRPDYLVGKILRLDVTNGDPYAIPLDNPFVDEPGAYGEVWQVGFRNPWRISFDRASGDLFIGDVGEETWEEVNVVAAGSSGGLNFGWRCYEGFEPLNLDGCAPPQTFTYPVFAYKHENGHCAIVGGYVYRGSQYPLLQGVYIFADFCTGQAWGLSQDQAGVWQHVTLGVIGRNVTAFGQDAQGELYVADAYDGQILKLGYTP